MTNMMQCLLLLNSVIVSAAPIQGDRPVVEPRGELLKRVDMVQARMLSGANPRFTDDFIVADVALRPDYPRRFSNYSGDLSGRYIGAFASMPDPASSQHLTNLVAEILRYQKADGRFGSAELKFSPEAIGLDHTALLWGNGRLLVGLLEYHASSPDPKVLEAARSLGDFLANASKGCMSETVSKRVNDLGAAGMICVSQLIEPLALLAEATGDAVYLEDAEAILPWFQQERGTQHSHGYLTTLRGLVLLCGATGDSQYLNLAKSLYDDLISSSDLLIYGGVREYFGDKYDRDEGCSEADFIRLSLQLWRATGQVEYLERAERCLLNQFYNDQFATGDFGHRAYFDRGVAPSLGQGRAWWCCTMHGLRAFRDVADAIVTTDEDVVKLNLFLDAQWSDNARTVTIETEAAVDGPLYTLAIDRAPQEGLRTAVRQPRWVTAMQVSVNGKAVSSHDENGYLVPEVALHEGDRLGIRMDLATRLVTRDGSTLMPDQLTSEPTEALLFRGPWLLGVNEADDPLFYGEPWQDNRILLPATASGQSGEAEPLAIPAAHVACTYIHGGYPELQRVVLQPLSEATRREPATFAVWLRYCAEGK